MSENREKFGSRLGFILVSAGCAIGLGNVWKFPYMCGKYGGAAFILIYLVFLVAMGLPIMVCEFSVGRASRQSVASSFKVLEPKGSRWHGYSYIGMIGNYLLLMFYTAVAGWMMYYCFRMFTGEFSKETVDAAIISDKYNQMLESPQRMMFWTVAVLILASGICILGVQKGIEKITKVMMTCLLALIIVLAVHSVLLPGAGEGVKFYLVPDFKAMAEIGVGNVVFAAMSQAFFTLSIGMGSMAIFGSYMDKERSITGETVSITVLDTFVALMAGIIVIPACFAYGIQPDAGPSLIFITLPTVFGKLAGGQIWGGLFFLFLTFAALSTVLAVFENVVSFGMDLWKWSRKKAVAVNIVAVAILSVPCVLGFNVWSGIQPLGGGSTIMDLEDFIVSNNVLPLGSLLYLMFCTKRYGWGWDNFVKEANIGKGMRFPVWLRKYMTYVLPLIVIVIYLKGYYDLFSNQGTAVLVFWMTVAVLFLGLIMWFSLSKKGEKA